MGVHPTVIAAMRGTPVAVEDEAEPLTGEERSMLTFIEELDHYRRGEPHELTPVQVTEVELAREDARELAEAICAADPADVREVVAEFIEAQGGHV